MNPPTQALIAAPPDPLCYSLQALLARLPQIDAVQSVEDTRSMLAQITTIAPRARTVVLVDHIDQQQALQATSADLVLLKGYPAADLFDIIERLLAQTDPSSSP